MTNGNSAPDFEKQIAERDEKNAFLEAQVAEAGKTAETAEKLRGEDAAGTSEGIRKAKHRISGGMSFDSFDGGHVSLGSVQVYLRMPRRECRYIVFIEVID